MVAAAVAVAITLGILLRPSAPAPSDTSSNGDDNQVVVTETSCDDTFQISLDVSTCTVDIEAKLGVASQYVENVAGDKISLQFNGIANHNVGVFPNSGNPNTISANPSSAEVPLNPTPASSFTTVQGYDFAVFRDGVAVDPFTAEFFTGSTGIENKEWNETALTSSVNLGLDCNNAHVQPGGEYHFHGVPSAYIQLLTGHSPNENVKPSAPIFLGYAADGFGVYYKWGYDENDEIVAFESGYRLKSGDRPGDGVTAPDGCYSGLYFQDYEYVSEGSQLDQANGRTSKVTLAGTPVYHYIMTDNWPSSPIFFRGTPDPSFQHAGGGGGPPLKT